MSEKERHTKGLPIHPVCELFPVMLEQQYEALRADIKIRNLQDAIWTYEDKVLDGRHRQRACIDLGMEPRYRRYRGNDPIGFVLAQNLHRRHLTTTQAAMVAARARTIFQEEAARRKAAGLRQNTVSLNLGSRGKVSEQVADIFGVSRASVEHAVKVLKDGSSELVNAVQRDEIAVSTAAMLTRRPQDAQRKAIEGGKEGIAELVKEIREARKLRIENDPIDQLDPDDPLDQLKRKGDEALAIRVGLLKMALKRLQMRGKTRIKDADEQKPEDCEDEDWEPGLITVRPIHMHADPRFGYLTLAGLPVMGPKEFPMPIAESKVTLRENGKDLVIWESFSISIQEGDALFDMVRTAKDDLIMRLDHKTASPLPKPSTLDDEIELPTIPIAADSAKGVLNALDDPKIRKQIEVMANDNEGLALMFVIAKDGTPRCAKKRKTPATKATAKKATLVEEEDAVKGLMKLRGISRKKARAEIRRTIAVMVAEGRQAKSLQDVILEANKALMG